MNEQVAKLIAGTNYSKFEEEARAVVEMVYDQLKVPQLKGLTDIVWNKRLTNSAGNAVYKMVKTDNLTNYGPYRSSYYAKRGVINLSTKIFAIFSEEERISTAAHEAVHIVDRYLGNPHDKKTQGHGYTWQQLMRQAGFKPDRYHCANTKLFRKRYETNCVSCGKRWEISSNMMTRLLSGERGAVCNCKARKYLLPSGWKLMKQEIV